jgi:plastocyanin
MIKNFYQTLALGLLLVAGHLSHAQVLNLQVPITSSTDDAEERGANANTSPGLMDLTSSDIELVYDGGDGDQHIGLRFANLPIPKGAQISKAYIQFTADEIDDSTGTVIFKVEDTDSASTFSATAFNISSRPRMADSVVWSNIPIWNNVGDNGPDQQTPDLSVLIQSAINRAGWKSGNALSILAYGTGERVAEAYDGVAALAPVLVLEYQVPTTLTLDVLNTDDDAEENIANGAIDLTSTDLELTDDGTVQQLTGIRFANAGIPAGATIQSAYIQFTVDEVDTTGVVNAFIAIEDEDNATTIGTGAGALSTRNYATANPVIWNIGQFGTNNVAGPVQRTPDLSAMLQQVVNRQGWVSGNALLFGFIDPAALSIPGFAGNTSKRVVQSRNNSASASAKLVVTYLAPASYQSGNFPLAKLGSWKYNDSGIDLDTAWTALNYNDSTWSFGDAILGYNNGNETTTLDFGSDPTAKYPTTYLRYTFNVSNAAQYDSLIFDVLRDDGVVVYVNGTEAFRMNMPTGAVNFNTLASAPVAGADETTYYRATTANLLQNGTNVIAVELHQATASSSDLSFDMEVGFKLVPLTPDSYPLTKNSDWHYLDNGVSLDSVAWTDSLFNDDNWAQGPAALGYGDPMNTTISFGSDPNNKHVTYYFRRDVLIDTAVIGDSVLMGIRRDDGAVIYLNGQEVHRTNMPAGIITSSTLAPTTVSGGAETTYYTHILPKSAFVNGRNTIAVEVHNRDIFSSDLGFDLYLEDLPPVNPVGLGCTPPNQNHISCFNSIAPTSQTPNLIYPNASHRFQMLHKQGDAYTKGGGTVPGNHDFTAYIGLGGSSEVGHLSVNHENTPGGVSMVDLHYVDSTKLWAVDTTQAVDFYNSDLVTTTRNCSGGITPWGTVLTAEETSNSGDVNSDGYTDVGWLVEIDPITAKVKEYGNGIQEKVWGAGNMSHENAAVLDDSITLYTGEDGGSSAVYKFIANSPADLSSGTLYVLKLDNPLSGGEPTGSTATWVQVPNTTQAERNNTRSLAIGLGATNFNGVEDIEVGTLDGKMYFTSKGNGRTYRFTDNGMTASNFETFVGGMSYSISTDQGIFIEPWGGGNDNLTFDDLGNLWVLQDGGRNYIWVVRAGHTQAAPMVEIFASMPNGSEPCGLTFSPDYRFGFVSIQHPSGSNTPQLDAALNNVAFDASASVVIARKENLGAQAPIAGFEADTTRIVKGNSVVFTDTSANFPNTRSWIFNGGNPATGSNKVETVTYANPGFYTVELRVSNAVGGDTAVSTQYIEVVDDVSLTENSLDNTLSIYPNPTQGEVKVALSLKGGEALSIELFDLTGRKLGDVLKTTAPAGKQVYNLDLSSFSQSAQNLVLVVKANGMVSHRVIRYKK